MAAPSRGREPIVSPSGVHFPFGKMDHDVLKLSAEHPSTCREFVAIETSGSPSPYELRGVAVAMQSGLGAISAHEDFGYRPPDLNPVTTRASNL